MDFLNVSENINEVSEVLKAISNPSRLIILCLLVQNEMSVADLKKYSSLSQSAFSQHLATLRVKNIVKSRKEKQKVYYSVKDNNIKEILSTLYSLYCNN